MISATSFTFCSYELDAARSIVICTYRVEFKWGFSKTFTDRLYFKDIIPEMWEKVPREVLEPTLQALLIMLGINYWCAFPTKDIRIEGFVLSKKQAEFWNTLYLHGLGEFFYLMKIDFHNLIHFPYDESYVPPDPHSMLWGNVQIKRVLLLNGAGKDSILSAEMLKKAGTPFDFFACAPTPAHMRIAELVGAKTVTVTRKRDPLLEWYMEIFGVSQAYPSVSTFTFIATLLAEAVGYTSIIFSNERSADIGNLTYRGLDVNHQWCKSTHAEQMINDYIQTYITPDISTQSLLRKYSELDIVSQFVQYPQYLPYVTSCNNYFWLPRFVQRMMKKGYWCKQCPKCVFLFASYAAYLPKKDVVAMFGADLYAKKGLLRLMRRILGVEGYKPLDCVGEPEEMILAMEYARRRGEYTGEPAMQVFNEFFPDRYDFANLEKKVFTCSG